MSTQTVSRCLYGHAISGDNAIRRTGRSGLYCKRCARQASGVNHALIRQASEVTGMTVREFTARYGQGRNAAREVIEAHGATPDPERYWEARTREPATHCKRGHPLRTRGSRRVCMTCMRDRETHRREVIRQAADRLGLTVAGYTEEYGGSRALAEHVLAQHGMAPPLAVVPAPAPTVEPAQFGEGVTPPCALDPDLPWAGEAQVSARNMRYMVGQCGQCPLRDACWEYGARVAEAAPSTIGVYGGGFLRPCSTKSANAWHPLGYTREELAVVLERSRPGTNVPAPQCSRCAVCSVDGCTARVAFARKGWCATHYHRQHQTGSLHLGGR